jgi:hypothetical protein
MSTAALVLCLCRRRGGKGGGCRSDAGGWVHAAEAMTAYARGSLAAYDHTEALHMCRGPWHLRLLVSHIKSHTFDMHAGLLPPGKPSATGSWGWE